MPDTEPWSSGALLSSVRQTFGSILRTLLRFQLYTIQVSTRELHLYTCEIVFIAPVPLYK